MRGTQGREPLVQTPLETRVYIRYVMRHKGLWASFRSPEPLGAVGGVLPDRQRLYR